MIGEEAPGTPGSRDRAARGGAARRARRPAGPKLLYEARLFPDIAYAFRHGLTRRVAYDGLLQESRRALHARVAGAIEARHADRLDEVVETLAHHSSTAPYGRRRLLPARRGQGEAALHLRDRAGVCAKAREISERRGAEVRTRRAAGRPAQPDRRAEAANQSYDAAGAL